MVEWTNPSTALKVRLYYQVCYYRTQDQVSFIQEVFPVLPSLHTSHYKPSIWFPFFRNLLSCKTFQRALSPWASWDLPLSRPSITRSRSGRWSSLSATRESPLSGAILWSGSHIRVLYSSTVLFYFFLECPVYSRSNKVIILIISIIINPVFCPLTATWSITTLIYIAISVCVVAVFLTLYCTVPACQRYFSYVVLYLCFFLSLQTSDCLKS